MSRFVPRHSYSKSGKKGLLFENLAHVENQSVFEIETLCNDTKDSVV